MRAIASTAPMRDPSDSETLANGTSGAIMVLGLFMALFLVGALYAVVGIGETILYRERMQDAADAAAFSAAVMDARGMNLIALINIIMAAMLAILVALQAVQLICQAGIGLATALSFFGGEVAIPPLTEIMEEAATVETDLKPDIMSLLGFGHDAELAIRDGMPFVAEGKAVILTFEAYTPPAIVGFVWPVATPLPTETAPFSLLCDKAASYVAQLLEIPFNAVHILDIPFVGDAIRGVFSGIAETAAAEVCGGTGMTTTPPGDYSKPRPLSPNTQECIAHHDRSVCAQGQADEQARTPNPSSGGCDAVMSPSSCEQRLTDAYSACRPSSDLFAYEWQEAQYVKLVSLDPMTHAPVVTDPVPALDSTRPTNPYHMGASNTPPCGAGGSVATTYNSPGNICQEDPTNRVNDAIAALQSGIATGTVRVTYRVVLNIDGCKEHGSPPPPGSIGSPVSGDDEHAPQHVRPGLHMGDEAFQLRGFIIGNPHFDAQDNRVRIANNYRDDSSTATRLFQTLRELGRLSTAQAEFYYDGADGVDPDEWLFNMSWRGRLRRFRIPSSLNSSSVMDACTSSNSGSGGGSCSGAGGHDFSLLDHVIIH